MKVYSLKEILDHAFNQSPYYRDLLKNSKRIDLSDVPIINQEAFWKSEILTSKNPDGIVFKSGGSSGAPKYSYFTHEEWKTFTEFFGWGIAQGILQKNDRVANLFYVGDLYASFLFIKDSLQSISVTEKPISQYPISGANEFKSTLKTIEEFKINVLCGVPSQILKLFEFFEEHKSEFQNIKIDRILFGGEAMYPDQVEAIKAIFPQIEISSIGCASVDGGLLGYITPECRPFEHRVFSKATIIEIVDPDTLELITEKNRVGKVLLTNLTRKLMPIIRYPAGDLAMWIEDENISDRKFKLMGRAEEAARLGTISVYFEDTRDMVIRTLKNYSGIQFQMILNHYDHKDELTLIIHAHNLSDNEEIKNQVIDEFIKEKKVYLDVLNKKMIHPLKVKIVKDTELMSNERTGKLKRIIDQRVK